jgi:hypothetical protein
MLREYDLEAWRDQVEGLAYLRIFRSGVQEEL